MKIQKETNSQKSKLKSADKRIKKLENISKEIEYSREQMKRGQSVGTKTQVTEVPKERNRLG